MNPLTDAEKVEIRRFCGYPAYGLAPTGMQSWRYFQVYGLLEFRLNNLSPAEIAVTRRYLATVEALEQAVPLSGENLDTDQASGWVHNKDEVQERSRLLDMWRRKLCGFVGVPCGPSLTTSTIPLVV